MTVYYVLKHRNRYERGFKTFKITFSMVTECKSLQMTQGFYIHQHITWCFYYLLKPLFICNAFISCLWYLYYWKNLLSEIVLRSQITKGKCRLIVLRCIRQGYKKNLEYLHLLILTKNNVRNNLQVKKLLVDMHARVETTSNMALATERVVGWSGNVVKC